MRVMHVMDSCMFSEHFIHGISCAIGIEKSSSMASRSIMNRLSHVGRKGRISGGLFGPVSGKGISKLEAENLSIMSGMKNPDKSIMKDLLVNTGRRDDIISGGGDGVLMSAMRTGPSAINNAISLAGPTGAAALAAGGAAIAMLGLPIAAALAPVGVGAVLAGKKGLTNIVRNGRSSDLLSRSLRTSSMDSSDRVLLRALKSELKKMNKSLPTGV